MNYDISDKMNDYLNHEEDNLDSIEYKKEQEQIAEWELFHNED